MSTVAPQYIVRTVTGTRPTVHPPIFHIQPHQCDKIAHIDPFEMLDIAAISPTTFVAPVIRPSSRNMQWSLFLGAVFEIVPNLVQ
jgi:hypothetical protein